MGLFNKDEEGNITPKGLFAKTILPALLQYISNLAELAANGLIPEEEMKDNPEVFAAAFAALEYADRRMGPDEKEEIPEVIVDEIKEAVVNLANQHAVEVKGVFKEFDH